jgi:hypothetical protein
VLGSPFGFTVPLSVAVLAVTLVAALVATLGVAGDVKQVTAPYVVPELFVAKAWKQ